MFLGSVAKWLRQLAHNETIWGFKSLPTHHFLYERCPLSFYEIQKSYLLIHIKVKPNKQESKILLYDDTHLHIALHAQPIEGKANEELIQFLANFLSVPKSNITLVRGLKSQIKTIKITTEIGAELCRKLY